MPDEKNEKQHVDLPQTRGGERSGQDASSEKTSGAPSISLPKGGGAIRGIGEKFAANPVTGTGSMSVPIFTSPGRADFGPQLILSYDSGSGNGPFGFGWSLNLPRITRKTSKGLPRYLDTERSDVFLLSGEDDLVPRLHSDGSLFEDTSAVPGYTIHSYYPRIEGAFARIERWTSNDGDVHWRTLSSDNILTIYGRDTNSRIADPDDPGRIFSWLISEVRNDSGDAIVYEYKPEDGDGVDLSQSHEHNRGGRDGHQRTANRYIKRILYGSRTPLLDEAGQRPFFLTAKQIQANDWMFEAVFDYGEHSNKAPMPRDDRTWVCRDDPFSSYRAGFEIRTYRRCQRVLMFHHFEDDENVGNNCLVRSTDFNYSGEPDSGHDRRFIYTFLLGVAQSGYKRRPDGYLKQSLPSVEFAYSEPRVQDTIEEVDQHSLDNLPVGLNGSSYQWIDLHGEGIPGILTEQAGTRYYKRNLSPLTQARSGNSTPEARFAPQETVAVSPCTEPGSGAEHMDLTGDGLPDLVVMDGVTPGFYEHDSAEGWYPFRAFASCLSRDLRDPNIRFIDLDGDGHADVLITEDDAFVWHASLADKGFGPAQRVAQALDEEKGPHLVFADDTQSIYLADLSGDGQTDLIRIRNGEICYWPNQGYGRFGARITMDNAPIFDRPDQFDHQRIRLADIDGSGTADIIYLHRNGVRLYFNQAGNGWSAPQTLSVFPRSNELTGIVPIDLLGNGTACLVWSSPLPGDATRPMRYVNLMGGQKPHLLVKTVNNLGAETHIGYAPSTRFYLEDKRAGKPWITKLPFPVHVVERVETLDRISRSRFVARYAYHHGHYDGEEREFRGFGLVEQWDTEQYAMFEKDGRLNDSENLDAASHVPPVLTRTWFHTGANPGRIAAGRQFGTDYFHDPKSVPLPEAVLPAALSPEEEREAHRTLVGAVLRREVFATTGSSQSRIPYVVSEKNYTVQLVQPRERNRHGVFLVCPRESISYHYERNRNDPRISHELTFEVDAYGNVLASAKVGYGRVQPDSELDPRDRELQAKTRIIYAQNEVTNAVDGDHDHRIPVPWQNRTFEVTGVKPQGGNRFDLSELDRACKRAEPIAYDDVPDDTGQKRLLEHTRTIFRRDDLDGALMPGELGSLALPHQNCKLALPSGLLELCYGGRVTDSMLEEGGYIRGEGDAGWWVPSAQQFYSPNEDDPAARELAFAQRHFFLPQRFTDPFGNTTFATYANDLVVNQTTDPAGNTVEAKYDFRVLQPRRITDPNGNRSAVAFDALGMVTGTAVMGKVSGNEGDSLAGFVSDLDETTRREYLEHPLDDPHDILQEATTRLVYDLFAYDRTRNEAQPQPAVVYMLARETHAADLEPGEQTRIQHSLAYSDGFEHVIQKKVRTGPGPLNEGGPSVEPRWVTSGWTIFNNKGKQVRQYEPFFTNSHRFEFDVRIGVSPILFHDPLGRVIGRLHPNRTYEKVVFDPWRQETWDVNDTLVQDPALDPDVGEYFRRLPDKDYLPTWYAERASGALGSEARAAAEKSSVHADTPTVAYFDTLGRPFLSVAHNKFKYSNKDPADAAAEAFHYTRVIFDIEGNQRAIIDANDRIVMQYDYDMLGNRVHQASMEAGERWLLNGVEGNPVRAWDSRGHAFRTEYDPLRRPLRSFVIGANPANPGHELLTEQLIYGEQHPKAGQRNLRGQVYLHFDQAGAVASETFDFKGNPLRLSRRIASEYRHTFDWSTADLASPMALDSVKTPLLEAEIFTTRTTYDAINRPIESTTPHTPVMRPNVIRPRYNEVGQLAAVDVNLRGEKNTADAPVWTPFVTDIDYNAKGQRTRIDYGNGVTTAYTYDPRTFRLIHLLTRRDAADFPGDCPQPTPNGWPGCQVQNLHYSYDPVGNITHIQDDAQQTIYFRNTRVEPSNDYTYDALYRLIEATGREHLGQGGSSSPYSHADTGRVGLPQPGDGRAMGRYMERYLYDAVGNFLEMQHRGDDPSNAGWTRQYAYDEPSLIEPDKHSNRLSRTTVGNGNPITDHYAYDAHGNMLRMPHLGGPQPDANMHWDYRDQLQKIDLGGGGTAYYTYDAAGQRTRKVVEKSAGLVEERLYLGGFEIYRKRKAGALALERETLHVMDDRQNIALVESRTDGDDGSPQQLVRYQFGNHLGSASLELDDRAQIISCEEYAPYGSSTYQAVRNQTDAPKRYRYTGKERDEESGFSYHTARYYAPWLGRWTAADPTGLSDGINLYFYVGNQPIRLVDSTGTCGDGNKTYGIGLSWGPDSGLQIGAQFTSVSRDGEMNSALIPFPYALGLFGGSELTYETHVSIGGPNVTAPSASSPSNKSSSQTQHKPSPEPKNDDSSFLDPYTWTFEKPGEWESLIPIWGSTKTAQYHMYRGNYILAGAYTALALSDVWLVRSIAAGLAKGTIELLAKEGVSKQLIQRAEMEAATEIPKGAYKGTGTIAFQEGEQWWVKMVNPSSGALAKRWGAMSIKAQKDALKALGNMAVEYKFENGRLLTKSVEQLGEGGLRLLNPTSKEVWREGSKRMGTIMNDIVPRNMSVEGKIFDPALDPLSISAGYLSIYFMEFSIKTEW